MTSAIERLPKHTIKITITLPWSEVKTSYEKVIEMLVLQAEIPGFRKGKAPRKLVEEKIDKAKIYEEVAKEIVPKAYEQSLKDHQVSPIVSPRINVTQAQEGKDWQFAVITCTQPEVNLGNYKAEVAKLKGAQKIWVPGSDPKQQSEEEKKGANLSQVLKVLLSSCTVDIPDLLIEDQLNKKLADLVDQVRQLGMTVESYLMSKGLTSEMLRSQYKKEAEDTLKLEFILERIADEEKVTVSAAEIAAAIGKVENETERKNLEDQKYYLSMLLRRQKTLDTLLHPIV